MNTPNIDPNDDHWRKMIAESEVVLQTYRVSNKSTRRTTLRALGIALVEVDQQSLEGQALSYLLGRLDEIDRSAG